ncbi:hypothetical protein CANARDRAFT_87362 [[Candida] arabinofermentans NRRL YB-2248]|uniref:TFIIS central domain-containing protein n=1 Tax=[Candida] arabinofermentans NRRL YB-2248 TaxID=983967 RepID=A0A1E4T616_9ASCO|nr:hypothetical protein CANARDRAFT_87362 [[Candida] arabinofermentans NRRL YB-2248]
MTPTTCGAKEACKVAVKKAFEEHLNNEEVTNCEVICQPSKLSATYERLLYEKHEPNINTYKLRFRKDLTSLKNKQTDFAVDLLTGKITVEEFSGLDESQLISKTRQKQDAELLDKELKSKITMNMPDTINSIKNNSTFVSEKWGVSESAAKIDQEFDTES